MFFLFFSLAKPPCGRGATPLHSYVQEKGSFIWSEDLKDLKDASKKESKKESKFTSESTAAAASPAAEDFARYLFDLFPHAWAHHEKLFVELEQKLYYCMIKGYALTADMQDRRCYFLFGGSSNGGSNGKSGDIKLTRVCMEGFFYQASK